MYCFCKWVNQRVYDPLLKSGTVPLPSGHIRTSQSLRGRMAVAPTAGIWWTWSWGLTRTQTLEFYCLAWSPGRSTPSLSKLSRSWWRTNICRVLRARWSTFAQALQVNMVISYVNGRSLFTASRATKGYCEAKTANDRKVLKEWKFV